MVGGYTLFVKDGKPTYEYNWFGQDRYRVTSAEPLPPGKSTIRVEFKYDGGGLAKGGTVTMFLNDKKVAEGRVEKTILGRFSADETFDTGLDTGSPVSDLYPSPFKFPAAFNRIEIDIAPTKFGAVERQNPSGAQGDEGRRGVAIVDPRICCIDAVENRSMPRGVCRTSAARWSWCGSI